MTRTLFRDLVYGALDIQQPRSLDEIAYRVGVLTTIEGLPKEKKEKVEGLLNVRRALDDLVRTRKEVKSGFVDSHVGWWRTEDGLRRK